LIHWNQPVYFNPSTPMLLNIIAGRNGVRARPRDEIVIFVSTMPSAQWWNARWQLADMR
jgi:hypothetical protein